MPGTRSSRDAAAVPARQGRHAHHERAPLPGLRLPATLKRSASTCARTADARSATTTRDLLRLTTVRTQRRDRISSDEEERRRSGFELQTSYRFAQHGAKPGRIDATAKDETGDIVDLAYGDSATIRITNVGRRRRMNPNIQGYLIDVATGRWLKENEKDEAPEEDGLDAAGGVKRKQRVIPYVEDRRNILVTRLTVPVSLDTAITAAIALERGIEAAFQLEDSELSAEGLPDEDGRGRALLVESAEGGAGVLRRLVDDPDALRKAARTALQIMHFDPDTGEDESIDEPRPRAMRARLLRMPALLRQPDAARARSTGTWSAT